MSYNNILPGQPLLDTNGKRVQAHGGSIFYDEKEKVCYFYGENKEFTTVGSKIWTWGVRAYRSKDLYNWEDCGVIIEPVLDDENSSLNPYTAMMDRPHIIYNRDTKKYVCWMKIMQKDGQQTETVATADAFLGPYTVVRERLKPLGMSAGDFDLAVARDGKAYYYFERVHSETICADLTNDYTDVTGYYSTHFPRPYPPYVREATAHFERNFKHYLMTSGTTGYSPNPSEVAVGDSWHGPYTVLGNPHPTDPSRTSFHSQISSVFKVPWKKDLYIALGDRWLPNDMKVPYEYQEEFYAGLFSGRVPREEAGAFVRSLMAKYGLSPEDMTFTDSAANTSIADYVWLPLRFVEPCAEYPNGMVLIDWLDEWRIEDYE